MMMLFGILFMGVIVALFALAFALVLSVIRPAMRWKRRALLAAIGAGFIPSLPAFIAVGWGMDFSVDSIVPLAAIFIFALFLSFVIGFPTAYFYTRSSEAKRNPPVDPDVFQ